MEAGAAHASLVLSQQDNQVRNDIDGDMFFEARVTATASGPPLTRSHREMQGDDDAEHSASFARHA